MTPDLPLFLPQSKAIDLPPLRKQQAVELYEMYPKKVGRGFALKAAEKAIRLHGYEPIKKALEAYIKAWNGETDFQFMPYPATWFNQERFYDDPATWERPKKEVKLTRQQVYEKIRELDGKIFHHPANPEGSAYGRRMATGPSIFPAEVKELNEMKTELKKLKGML